jgi:hypothetical protein
MGTPVFMFNTLMLKYMKRIQKRKAGLAHSGSATRSCWRSVSFHRRNLMPAKKKSRRKYSKKASSEVRTEMRHKKSGKHKIKSRKQAIAIGLSKARRKGAKVPKKK